MLGPSGPRGAINGQRPAISAPAVDMDVSDSEADDAADDGQRCAETHFGAQWHCTQPAQSFPPLC